MRVLVCGGRDFTNHRPINTILSLMHQLVPNDLFVIFGDATGADAIAKHWAERNNIPHKEYTADWRTFGRGAGPKRNRLMLDDGKPDLVLAFPTGRLSESRGTKNMVEQARAAGIATIIYGE